MRKARWLVLFVAVVGGAAAFAVGAIAYLGGGLTGFDFGFYVQAAHLIASGHLNPVVPVIHGHPYISDDLEFYMYPLALLFKVWPSPWLLILLQAGMFATVLALAGRYATLRGLRGYWLAVFLALALLYPPASDAIGGFHWDLLAAVFGFAMLLALMRERLIWAMVFALLILPVREDAGLVVASVAAIYVALTPPGARSLKAALLLGSLGLLYSLVAMAWIMPVLSSAHAAYMARLMFGNAVSWRERIVASLSSLLWLVKWRFAVRLLFPLALLPLLRPRLWPAIALATAVLWLSLNTNMFSGYFQYIGAAIPALYVATAEGLIVLRSRWVGYRTAIMRSAVMLAMLLAWALGMFLYIPLENQVASYAQEISRPWITALLHERRIVGNASLLTTQGDVVYVGNERSRIVPPSAQGSALPLFTRKLGTRFVELSNYPYGATNMGDVAPYLQTAIADGYKIAYRSAGSTLLERTPRYRPIKVVAEPGVKEPGTWRSLGSEYLGTAYLASKLSVPRGWWQADVSFSGRGEALVCALAGTSYSCGSTEYFTGITQRPIGFYAAKNEQVNLIVFTVNGTDTVIHAGQVEMARLSVIRTMEHGH